MTAVKLIALVCISKPRQTTSFHPATLSSRRIPRACIIRFYSKVVKRRLGTHQLNCPWDKRVSSALPLPVCSLSSPSPPSHPLLKLWSSSVHWMWTSSWFSSWSAFPQVMLKSFMSLRACRRESMVSAVIWIITPSEKKREPLSWLLLKQRL